MCKPPNLKLQLHNLKKEWDFSIALHSDFFTKANRKNGK